MNNHNELYVAGIGASAGGLNAITSFASKIRPDAKNISYIIVQHLAPDQPSYMKEILEGKVKVEIRVIKTGDLLEGGILYLTPPGKRLAILSNRFVLQVSGRDTSPNKSIDHFFISLANQFGKQAIGVILSGSGSDGLKGCQEIYEKGGEVIVQSPSEAEFTSMPESILNSGFFSKESNADDIFDEIVSISLTSDDDVSRELMNSVLSQIDSFGDLFGTHFHINIRDYKAATLARRISKRMTTMSMKSVPKFVSYLNGDEVARAEVFNDVMINVTKFFRDPEFYDSLQNLFDHDSISEFEELRIWCAGCSTGEEAYSILITLLEVIGNNGLNIPVKIFATDINEANISHAAKGTYSKAALSSLNNELLEKYFDQSENDYTIKRPFREKIIFSRHDLLNSPPFTNINLTVCRNLLIYLTPQAQGRALINLMYSLRTQGYLALGPSESVGVIQKNLTTIDRKWRIFRKDRNYEMGYASNWRSPKLNTQTGIVSSSRPSGISSRSALMTIIKATFPNALIISEDNDLMAVFGNGRYLLKRHLEGVLSQNIESLLLDDYLVIIKNGIVDARSNQEGINYKNVEINSEEGYQNVDLHVRYYQNEGSVYVVDLKESDPPVELEPESKNLNYKFKDGTQVTEMLRYELNNAKVELNEVVHELGVTNEELQTSNEELISSNEELQSTNEELNSVNEELYTLNSELQQKIEQVTISNDDLKNLIETTQIGVIYLDMSCKIRRITHIVEDHFKIRETDIGRPVFELEFGRYLKDYQGELESGMIREENFTITSANGDIFNIIIHPYLTDQNEQIGYVLSIINTNEASRRENFLNQTQSTAKISGWLYDVDSNNIHWTKQINELVPENDVPHTIQNFLKFYSKEDQDRIESYIDRCVKANVAFELTCPFKASKQEHYWVKITGEPLFYNKGQASKIQGTLQDVTQTKLEEDRLQMAIDSAHLGVWDLDLVTNAISFDDSIASLIRVEGNRSTVSEFTEILHHEDRAKFQRFITRVPTQRESEGIMLRTAAVPTVYLNVYVRPYRDIHNQPYKLIGVIQDVSEVVKTEKRLEEERKTNFQNAKLASLGELASGVGHEINNPLAVILTLSNIILDKKFNESSSVEDLYLKVDKMRTAGQRINRIVQGLRVFARSNEDMLDTYDLDKVVKSVLDLTKSVYDNLGVQLEYNPSAEGTFAEIEFGKLQQVILNLISNAKDAIQNEKKKVIEIVTSHEGDKAFISVIDTGPGIPEENLSKIFDSFFTTKAVGQGTGLGLSLSKSMVESMGGTLTVESKLNFGSKFTITLNRMDAVNAPEIHKEEAKAKDEREEEADIGNAIKVMIVDDVPDLVEVLSEYLELMGFDCSCFTSQKQALKFLKSNEVDVIVTDFQMPEKDGYEFLIDAQKAVDWYKEQPIAYLVSGNSDNFEEIPIPNAQVPMLQGGLSKPIDEQELKRKILKKFKMKS